MPIDTGRYTGYKLQGSMVQAIVERIEAGQKNHEIHDSLRVDPKTVWKYRLDLEAFDQPYPPRCIKIGRPPLLRQCHKDALLELLEGKPTAYIDEMQAFLCDDFDVQVSPATITRALSDMRWTRNMPADVRYSARHSERWTLLPAMDVDGYVDHIIY